MRWRNTNNVIQTRYSSIQLNSSHSFCFCYFCFCFIPLCSLRYLQFESRALPSIETLARLPKSNNVESGGAIADVVSASVTGHHTATTIPLATSSDPWNTNILSTTSAATAVLPSGSLNALHNGKSVVNVHDTNITCGNNGLCISATTSTTTTTSSNTDSIHVDRCESVCSNVDANTIHTNSSNGSSGTNNIHECSISHASSTKTTFGKSNRSGNQAKLPSLLIAPKIAASLDNCKCILFVFRSSHRSNSLGKRFRIWKFIYIAIGRSIVTVGVEKNGKREKRWLGNGQCQVIRTTWINSHFRHG